MNEKTEEMNGLTAEEVAVTEVWETDGAVLQETKRKGFWQNNAGVGVVEVILILVVLIALVLIFKDQLTAMVEKAMDALEKSMEGILS